MAIFHVRYFVDVVVSADSKEQVDAIAKRNWDDIILDERGNPPAFVQQIERTSQLPGKWTGECLPWGSKTDKMLSAELDQ